MSEFELRPARRSLRLPRRDYSEAGYYFITLCSHGRDDIFGVVLDGEVHLNAPGYFVREEWAQTQRSRDGVILDEFVIMPDHVHGIILLDDLASARGKARRHHAPCSEAEWGAPTTPTERRFGAPDSGSLSTVIRSFKSATSKWINRLRQTPGAPVWQRNFYERVIRDEDELSRTREYIRNNPARWKM